MPIGRRWMRAMIDALRRLYDADHVFDSIADLDSDLSTVSALTDVDVAEAAQAIGVPPGVVRGIVQSSRFAPSALANLRQANLAPSAHNLIRLLRQSEDGGEKELQAGAWFILHKLRGGGAALFELRRKGLGK